MKSRRGPNRDHVGYCAAGKKNSWFGFEIIQRNMLHFQLDLFWTCAARRRLVWYDQGAVRHGTVPLPEYHHWRLGGVALKMESYIGEELGRDRSAGGKLAMADCAEDMCIIRKKNPQCSLREFLTLC